MKDPNQNSQTWTWKFCISNCNCKSFCNIRGWSL